MPRIATPARLALVLVCLLGLAGPARAAAEDADCAVQVTWAPSSSLAVIGYHVYRALDAQGPFTPLTAQPLATALAFIDTTVQDGATYFYAASAVDAEGRESDLAGAAQGVAVRVDRDAPLVLAHAPFADQGLPLADGTPAPGRPVPADSGLFVRLWDAGGVDLEAVSLHVLVNGQPAPGQTTLHPVRTADATDLFVRFVPARRFPFGAQVTAGLDATDRVGNGMPPYQFRFQIETAAEHAAADAAAPEATRTVLEDGTQVLRTATATATIPAGEPQFVSFGEGASFGAWAHLDQIQYYAAPLTVSVPLDAQELTQADRLHVLRYDEATDSWTAAVVGDGWLVSLSVTGGAAQLELAHSGALALAFGG